VTVITCPLTLGEVSVTFVRLTVPVKLILLDESKQSEPYMYIVPATWFRSASDCRQRKRLRC